MKYLKISTEVRERVSRKAMNNEDMTNEEIAVLLIIETEEALERGTKHYNAAGELLESVEAILTTLRDEGGVTLEPVKDGQSGR